MGSPLLRRTPERQAIYEQAIRLIDQGEKPVKISSTYGIPEGTVREWSRLHRKKKAKHGELSIRNSSTVLASEAEIAPISATETYRDKLAERASAGLHYTEALQPTVQRGLECITDTLVNSASALAEMTKENVRTVVTHGEYGVTLNTAPLDYPDHSAIADTVAKIGDTLSKLHQLPYFASAAPKDPIIKPGSKHMHLHQHAGGASRPVGKTIYRHDAPMIPAPESTASVIDADLVTVIDAQIVDD